MFYRRRLPHWIPEDRIIFLTWRLADSTPVPPPDIITLEYLAHKHGACRVENHADDKPRSSAPPLVNTGPLWLRDPRIARMVTETLQYGETVRRFYDLYAWVIMPNHVHVVLKPRVELARTLRWLKGRTARMANRLLARTGNSVLAG